MVPRWVVGRSAPHRSLEDAARLEDGTRPDLRSARAETINTNRLLVQLAVTGGLLLLWLRVAKPEE